MINHSTALYDEAMYLATKSLRVHLSIFFHVSIEPSDRKVLITEENMA